MIVRLSILLAFSILALSGSALAEESATHPIDHPAECRIAQHQIENDFLLPHVAQAIVAKRLNVLVIGGGSSILPGPSGAGDAYPARLQAALAEKRPDVTVKVTADVRPHRSAMEMIERLPADLAAIKPALLVWQTGTVDAMQSIDQDEFSQALEKGIDIARSAGADVVLINAQYSPRTEFMIALGAYAENMRLVGVLQEIPLFDRFSIMKLWADLGVFDLYKTTDKLDVARRVHDCLGSLLADMILDATKPRAPLADSVR